MAQLRKQKQDNITYQRMNGHPNCRVDECGLFVPLADPWLAASPNELFMIQGMLITL